jgi:hypothetical protein
LFYLGCAFNFRIYKSQSKVWEKYSEWLLLFAWSAGGWAWDAKFQASSCSVGWRATKSSLPDAEVTPLKPGGVSPDACRLALPPAVAKQ